LLEGKLPKHQAENASDIRPVVRDWRMLYEKTGSLLISSLVMKNRRRLWDLLEDLAVLLEEPLSNDTPFAEIG
jgi:hypothetical protein